MNKNARRKSADSHNVILHAEQDEIDQAHMGLIDQAMRQHVIITSNRVPQFSRLHKRTSINS